jgi:hypothetical protein
MAAALGTLGTANTTVLPAFVWGVPAGITNANFPTNYVQGIGLLNAKMTEPDNSIIVSGTPTAFITQGFAGALESAMLRDGMLNYPSRGFIKLFPGDVIAVDPNTGFPIFINAYTAAQASWAVANNS